jgi:Periplasmic protease
VNPYPIVCDLVYEKIYLDEATMKEWRQTCLRRSALVTRDTDKNLILKDISNVLGLLQVSHLEIFNPGDVKKIWTGAGKSTGLEGEFVDSELVVFRVLKDSAAEKAGIKRGDIVVSINGEQPSPWTMESQAGEFKIKTLTEEKTVTIEPSEVQKDEKPRMEFTGKQQLHLVIPSFRAEFFNEELMREMKTAISQAEQITLDLRGNPGGNFVAGLRVLSYFLCEPKSVGMLYKPRSQDPKLLPLPDDLDDIKQVELLHLHRGLDLLTYKLDSCWAPNPSRSSLRVLVDGQSASVAEMVAQALKELRGAKIEGAPSRGQLLVGVWYPVDELGEGVQISIPEAVYESAKGHKIEGQGVSLDRILFYNLNDMRQGKDSWLK